MKNRFTALWAVFVLSVFVITPVQAANSEADKQLVEAARQGNMEEMWRLLAAGASVNARDDSGMTPLHWAGNVKVAEILLKKKGIEVNARDNIGWTPLHYCAIVSDAAVAKLLLLSGADIEAKDDNGETPLCSAVGFNTPEVVGLLLIHGADVESKSDGKSLVDVWKGEYRTGRFVTEWTENQGRVKAAMDKYQRIEKESADKETRVTAWKSAISAVSKTCNTRAS